MGDTSIQWTDKTWNPVRGCSRISPGCGGPNKQGGCYAEKIAARFSGPGEAFDGYAHYVNGEARWTGKMGLIDDKLDEPLRWRKPARVFVNSMSDLFHENLADEAIDRVFAVMADCPQHTFQVLTKRADRMRDYCANPDLEDRLTDIWRGDNPDRELWNIRLPLPNIWLGVSVEDQERADERIPALLDTPAAKRFISAEPLLGPVRLPGRYPIGEDDVIDTPALDWVIVGGESGGRSRSFDIGWAREIVEQCKAAGVACFVKQLGRHPVSSDGVTVIEGEPPAMDIKDKKGGDMAEWPTDLRVREFPA